MIQDLSSPVPVVEAVLLPVVQVLIMYRKEWELWVTLIVCCSHNATTNAVTHKHMPRI